MEYLGIILGLAAASVATITWLTARWRDHTNKILDIIHIENVATREVLKHIGHNYDLLTESIVHAPDGKQVYLPLPVVLRAMRQVESVAREKSGKGTVAPVLPASKSPWVPPEPIQPASIVDIVRSQYGESVSGAPDSVQIASEIDAGFED